MYTLYGGGVTRSLGPQMVLEEGGIPYTLKVVDELAGEHRAPDYLALNPTGTMPTLVTPEGAVMHEAPALMVYLAERHALEDLIPSVANPLRGLFFTKLFYHTNEILPPTGRFFRPERYSTMAEHAPAIKAKAHADALDRWSLLDEFLAAHGPYHLGERFSLLDLHMTLWAAYGLETIGELTDRFEAVGRCFALTVARPRIGPRIAALQGAMQQWRKAKAV